MTPLDTTQLIRTLVELGRQAEAQELFASRRAAAEEDSAFFHLALSAAHIGKIELVSSYTEEYVGLGNPMVIRLARLYMEVGDLDSAFAALDKAYEQKINWVTRVGEMRNMKIWADFVADPRYEELLKKLGIPI